MNCTYPPPNGGENVPARYSMRFLSLKPLLRLVVTYKSASMPLAAANNNSTK